MILQNSTHPSLLKPVEALPMRAWAQPLGIMAALLGLVVGLMGLYPLNHDSPYVQKVLALPGDSAQGAAIFSMNCAVCHGLMADGKVGPSLKNVSGHKSPTALIEQVISGKTPPMPQFQPDPQMMADLLSYLKNL
jgi:mono/diheme cytochrome c family protein